MHPQKENFKRLFTIESTLLLIFICASVAYVARVVPPELTTPIFATVALIGLVPVINSALVSIVARKVNVDLLAAIALFFSLIASEWSSALFINIMLSGARLLDLYTKRRVYTSLEGLVKLKPSKARVKRNGKIEEVDLNDVHVGDLVTVNLGEQIPVDGRVCEGTASIDQSSLTGESFPTTRTVNDFVFSATVIVSGNIVICAEHIGAETTFERMIKLVASSYASKSRMKTLGELFASSYIIIMLVVASVTYAITHDLSLVLAIVLVVCADDIAIATPIAFIATIGTAARQGVIIKSADFLERMAKITTLIVDKTGTLTMGQLVVKNVRTFGNISPVQMLELSGALCNRSNHPVAKAILHYTSDNGIQGTDPDHFEELEGRGIHGIKDGKKVILGRPEYLHEQGVSFSTEIKDALLEESSQGRNTTLVSYGNEVVGLFALADEIRPTVANTIKLLKQMGPLNTVMLTGDNSGVARSIAHKTGIDTYYADLLPEHKVFVLQKFLAPNKTVAMIGDGVNDAGVLARADIGIAMGGIGADAAIDSADIVLMKDDFSKLLNLRQLSRKVMNVAYGNFVIWGVVNIVGLYLVFTHVLNPAGAAAYNFITDFIPIANSLRMFHYKKKAV